MKKQDQGCRGGSWSEAKAGSRVGTGEAGKLGTVKARGAA